jgi:hypothetical protein
MKQNLSPKNRLTRGKTEVIRVHFSKVFSEKRDKKK